MQPTLIAEIEYHAWTHDGNLRHATYKRLREHQDNAAVFKLDRNLFEHLLEPRDFFAYIALKRTTEIFVFND